MKSIFIPLMKINTPPKNHDIDLHPPYENQKTFLGTVNEVFAPLSLQGPTISCIFLPAKV